MENQMKASCNHSQKIYLDLLKKTLTNWVHGHEEWKTMTPIGIKGKLLSKLLPPASRVIIPAPCDYQKREFGQDWPEDAHTMIGMKRLNNLENCILDVLEQEIPGDFIETGVWRGGSVIFMRGALKAFNITDRQVWVADSFEGLPKPNTEKYPQDIGDTHYTYDFLKVSLESVQKNFQAYDLLDSQVVFLKGWFKDTLPNSGIKQLAILRLDGDMYESTTDALTNLYPLLSVGGYIIIDDYCLPNCSQAVHDFRKEHHITDEIKEIDGTGVYWKRTK